MGSTLGDPNVDICDLSLVAALNHPCRTATGKKRVEPLASAGSHISG